MSVTSITKRTLTEEIIKIDEKVEYITKLKEDAMESLEVERRSARASNLPMIDQKISRVKSETSNILREYEAKEQAIKKSKISLDLSIENLAKLDDELIEISERHARAVEKLEMHKAYLQERLASIEKLDDVLKNLEESLGLMGRKQKQEMQKLAEQRAALLARKDLSPSELALQLAELDKLITEKEEMYAQHVAEVNAQIHDMKGSLHLSAESLNDKKNDLLDEMERIRQLMVNATPSQMIEYEKQLADLQSQIDEIDGVIKMAGISSREKLMKLLEMRGLSMTPSGRICTGSGRILTFAEARNLGLLDGLDEELLRLRGLTITPSGRILTKSGELYSRSEAERLGLLKGINLDAMYGEESESESICTSTASTMSGMSSSDVHYLKTVLGIPLTLALAEITAKQPRDPIHYLGHWLFKYRYNQEIDLIKKKELRELMEERERIAKLTLHQFAEQEAQATLIDLLGRVDYEVERKQIEIELKRIEAEAAAMEAENEELEYEARDTLGTYGGPTMGQQL